MQPTEVQPIQVGWRRGEAPETLLAREWLVTNGLGGYASGTIGGPCTRRFHGILIAALPAPLGRVMMFNHLEEWITTGDTEMRLSGSAVGRGDTATFPDSLEEFVLECGLPVWRYSRGSLRLEKRVLMPYQQNTTFVLYRLIAAAAPVTLHLRPSLHFRPHEGLLSKVPEEWEIRHADRDIEVTDKSENPPLRISALGTSAHFERDEQMLENILYHIEKSRGYEHEGPLWSPGVIHIELTAGEEAGLVASVESFDVLHALSPVECTAAENERRNRLLAIAGPEGQENVGAQLVLAADQFLIRPRTRAADEARGRAAGDDPRTVIAGYHWFTDWGRDTMISLEGLTLVTGRHREAGNILRTFASYIRDGLIPNMFPEGEHQGLYHTADATMWFFHAVYRYLRYTSDRETVRALIPRLVDIIERHVRGTHFNIHVDESDGLLAQGAEGYQLTWMDAKVDGWVVTPRRGKAVEINALFYNALRILQELLSMEGDDGRARKMDQYANRVRESFNERFWYAEGGYLFDVVDAEAGGNDPALRPNQIFAVSLDFPVLDETRWKQVVQVVKDELLSPVGLRSLARNHADYKPAYDGDLRARDAAYHQGTVWSWLIGPFIDAWMKVNPRDHDGAIELLAGFKPHLGDACIGTVSEVFDAEAPYHPRGCAAQAWGVAEVLRCLHKLR